MRCREVHAWFLVSRADRELPGPVRRHLRGCPDCRRARRRLATLDRAVAGEAAAAVPAPGAARVKALIADQPAPAPITRGRPRWLMAAACLVIGCFAVLFSGGEADRTTQRGLPGSGTNGGDEADGRLVGRMVDHYLVLAGSSDPAAQARAFAEMAQDLAGESVRVAYRGDAEQIRFVATLYERAVRRGALGRAAAIPPADRPASLPNILPALRQAEARLAADEPGAATLRPLVDTTRQAITAIESGELPQPGDEPGGPSPVPAGTPPVLSLVAALVNQGLLIAGEESPLVRVYACGDLADRVNLTSMVCSLRGERDLALILNRQAERVVDQGMATNVARVGPAGPRAQEVERLLHRTRQTVEALEAELARSDGGTTLPGDRTKALEKDLKDLAKSVRDLSKDAKQPGGKEGHGKKKK